MDWTHTFTIIGVLGAFTFWLFNKLGSDIKDLKREIQQQSQRTDRLYEMFIDLVNNK